MFELIGAIRLQTFSITYLQSPESKRVLDSVKSTSQYMDNSYRQAGDVREVKLFTYGEATNRSADGDRTREMLHTRALMYPTMLSLSLQVLAQSCFATQDIFFGGCSD